ncbi:MAG: polysaccharide biosynthesis/export family protein [Chitinispirillaceae bacterium]|nr:polysaccharide biosynthesis/export family protein [Chitinispirillaceae bacterium]
MKQMHITSIVITIIACISHLHATEPGTAGQLQQPQAAASAAAIGDAARPLPFRPGDALEIVTYPDSTGFPAGFYAIDGEGFVDFPIIGYVKVTGMSSDALAKMLAEKYVDFMRYPHMRIRPLIRVALNGGFFRPGLYWVNPHATLWETIQTAGGTQRMDGFKKLKWERDRIVVNNDLVPLIQDGKSLYQIGFKTGDQLTVLQQPLKTGWEVFRTDVLPIISFSISTAVSVITLYNTFMLYDYYRSNR